MGIDTAWVNEQHEPRQEVFDAKQELSRLANSRWPGLSSSVCLRFIDAYGDCTFNQFQIPELLRELRDEVLECKDKETRMHLEKVVRLVERAVGATHTYIKFIGD